MSRSIDPQRPQKLTPTQSALVNNLPCIVKLSQIAAHLSGSLEGSQREERYQKVQKRLTSERARQRRLLLLDIVDQYKKEQPVINSERQLSGKVVDEDVRGALERSDHMTPKQLLLIDAVLTLPKTSLERECQRRITVINAVMAYCSVKEGVTFRRSRASRPVPLVSAVKDEKPLRSEADVMLRRAISSVTTDKRPTICFACLRNPNLTIQERVVSFSSPSCLTRHFMRKHVRRLRVHEPTECRICDVQLEHRMHFQNHAEKFHRTVSQSCNQMESLISLIAFLHQVDRRINQIGRRQEYLASLFIGFNLTSPIKIHISSRIWQSDLTLHLNKFSREYTNGPLYNKHPDSRTFAKSLIPIYYSSTTVLVSVQCCKTPLIVIAIMLFLLL